MRVNQPVTQVETLLLKDQFIYSRTDLKGIIVATATKAASASSAVPIAAVSTRTVTVGAVTAGTASVGTANATTGTVSGSLNFVVTGATKPTYAVVSQPKSGTVTVTSSGTYSFTPTQIARDTAAVSAGTSTATFKVKATVGLVTSTETVTVPISPTTIVGDSTALLQGVFDSMTSGQTLTLAARTFQHSGVLQLRVAGVTINGNGATLQATNDATSAVQIVANNVKLSNITLTAPLTGPRYDTPNQAKLVLTANYDTVSNVTINGSAASGIFVYGAGWFTLSNVKVSNTRADGIHMTDGAHDGTVTNATTTATGDDGIAIVSYLGDGKECYNITVNSPTVNGTVWGRGISVVGGQGIKYNNITVSNTNAAGVYVASEEGYNSYGVNNVTVTGGRITGANYNPAIVHGAIMVYAGNPGQAVTGVSFTGISISGTPVSAEREIGLIQETGATMSNIAFANITIDPNSLWTFGSNVARSVYTATGFVIGGVATVMS